MEHNYDLVIVGGGAAGMIAAISAAISDIQAGDGGAALPRRICILEKNSSLGEKLKITGGGRCNITNNTPNVHEFLKVYGKDNKYLYSPFSVFGVQDTFVFFESRGLPLVTQARNRVFPQTEKALDVFLLLEKEIKKLGIDVFVSHAVTKINTSGNVSAEKTSLRIESVIANKKVFTAKQCIFATGGLSHPETGSTGDGFKWLRDLGHSIVKPTPSIVPLKVKESYVHELSGTSLSFMKITFFVDGKKAFSKKGKVLFTHFGLSGPLILNSAKQVGDLMHTGEISATIDMYPDTDIGSLDVSIRNTFDQNKNKDFKNVIKDITPEGMHNTILKLISKYIDPNIKVHSITKDDRRKIVDLLKAFPMTISGLMGFDRAVVADGGVPLSEINTKTMQSKQVTNLFIVGDLLHVNRPSGGYSLQLCWTTGFVAGKNTGK